jgi:hypothetical protein
VTFVQRYHALPATPMRRSRCSRPKARAQPAEPSDSPASTPVERSTATVHFVQKDGTTSNEPYQFVKTTDGFGNMIMDSFSRV